MCACVCVCVCVWCLLLRRKSRLNHQAQPFRDGWLTSLMRKQCVCACVRVCVCVRACAWKPADKARLGQHKGNRWEWRCSPLHTCMRLWCISKQCGQSTGQCVSAVTAGVNVQTDFTNLLLFFWVYSRTSKIWNQKNSYLSVQSLQIFSFSVT